MTGHAVEKRQVPDPLSSAGILGKASGGVFLCWSFDLGHAVKKKTQNDQTLLTAG